VQTVGSDRSLAPIPASLDQVKQTAHAQNSTVNDVLLAVTAGGPRELLRSRGELADGLTVRIDVPVTLRPAQDRDQARGNLIGQFVVPLPAGVADPGRRLAQIVTKTTTRKAESHPSVGAVLSSRIGPARAAKDPGPRPRPFSWPCATPAGSSTWW
jgi:diacylglycerol O-acyltransferase / wax synthase